MRYQRQNSRKKIAFAFILLLIFTVSESNTVLAEEVQLKIPPGSLLGETLAEFDDIAAFKGIPFATPPVGKRRWAPPQPIENWVGSLSAKTDPPACIQQITQADLDRTPEYVYVPQSEDCLYLNVFTPVDALRGKTKQPLPVLFLIHGGGRTRGFASTDTASIAALNRRGIVVVTPQYRLGIFSFFAHPELSAESPHQASGNYGMLDLVEALKWVQTNIAYFGGDPAAVTVSGASGGGTATGVLLATPLTKGLFHRAAPFCSNAGIARMHRLKQPYLDQLSAEALGVRFAQSLDVQSLDELRNIPARQIQQYVLASDVAPYDPPSGAGEVVDGWMLPQSIIELHQTGARNDVPVMLGFNADEVSVFAYAGLVEDIPANAVTYENIIKAKYGNLAKNFLRLYPSDKPVDAIYNAARDRVAGYGAETVARLSHRVSSPTYLYYMAHRPPNADEPVAGTNIKKGVAHCADAQYFYRGATGAEFTGIDRQISKTMSDYFISFIKTGNPNHAERPQWKAYGLSNKDYLLLEQGKAQPSSNLLPGMWELHEDIRLLDEKQGQFRSWRGGWASDSLLLKNGLKSD